MKYIATYFTSFTIVLLTIVAFNWFIDPFGMFWSPQIEQLNKIKTEAGKRSRITKAYQVNAIKPQIMIVGNSRVEMGLNPDHPLFGDKIVYNQGMPGASVAMQVDYALDAIHNNHSIKQLFIGIDFLDFLLTEQQIKDYTKAKPLASTPTYTFRLASLDQDKRPTILRVKEKMSMLFSLDALSASLSTIFKQNGYSNSINQYGFNDPKSYIDIINTEGIKPLFTQKLNEISIKLNRSPWRIKAKDTFPFSPVFEQLNRLINLAEHKKIKLTFFINPYHYSYLHTLADNQQWDNFLLWKKTVTQFISSSTSEEPIALWDFSGFSNIVNESVPLTKPKAQMQWYWEPAHYRKRLGDMMLQVMNTSKGSSSHLIGRKLAINSIDKILTIDNDNLKESSKQWSILKKELMIQE